MNLRRGLLLAPAIAVAAIVLPPGSGGRHVDSVPPAVATSRLGADAFGKLPVRFEANLGQTDAEV